MTAPGLAPARPNDINERHSSENEPDPEISVYRDYTIGLLKRYFRMSIELGRLPSVLGREFFRSKVTSYRIHSFEDVVILVHDVEQCISRLDKFSQTLIARVVLQEYTREEAAESLGCSRKTVGRYLPLALDLLTEMFLRSGLLQPMVRSKLRTRGESCQGVGSCPKKASA